MGGRSGARTRAPRLPRVTVLTFLILATVAIGAFGVTRDVVRHTEERLLEERAAEVEALLKNSIDSNLAVLRILAVLASSNDQFGFEQGAATLVRGGGSVVAVAETEAGFTVRASVPPSGQTLGGDRESLAARALNEQAPVGQLSDEGSHLILRFAVAAPTPSRVVAIHDARIALDRPTPAHLVSPFSEIRGALYAAPVPDPRYLVVSSEPGRRPIPGQVRQVPFSAGAETWTLVVAPREPLAGRFTQNAPWLVLGAGLVAALLAGIAVQVMARRNSFATEMVEARTKELEATRGFLERLLASAPTVVVRGDLTGDSVPISYVSPNVDRIFGIPPAEILGAGSLMRYVHPDDAAAVRAFASHGGGTRPGADTLEFCLEHADGSYRWVSALAVPDTGGDGAPAPLVYLTDITKRRNAEQALREAQQAAESANRSKSEFLSRMSHELRTPLNSVLGFGQILMTSPLEDDERDAVDYILRAGRHLLDLINEVLDISRIETGKLLLSPEAVDVHELITESLELMRPLAEERGIQLFTEQSAGEPFYVFADRQRAKQVLLNLLSNAVKYNRPRGTVIISTSQDEGVRLRINVADTGPGIRAEQMDRLFAPFDRLDAGLSDVEGTGIGLTVSRSLTEAMGGTLTVDSTVGQGSTFTVELPRVEGPVERYERLPAPPVPDRRVERSDAPARKVLYIEDNPSNVKLIQRILGTRRDVEIVSAMQGRLGVELARLHRPALILLDLHLPDMGGEEVLRRLREDPGTESIPVVIVTADATTGHFQRLLSAGATAYLTKPFDIADLHRQLDEVLGEGPG